MGCEGRSLVDDEGIGDRVLCVRGRSGFDVGGIGDRGLLGVRAEISPCNFYDLQIDLRTLRICIEGSDSINDKEGNN